VFNITETPGTTIYVNSDSAGDLKLVQVALGSSGTDLPSQSGNSGKVLGTDGADLSWVDPSGLPEQSGNAGKVLGTDGSDLSWVAQTGGGSSLPSTSGHSNEILSNDGADLDWRGIDSFLPDQSGHSNEVLITVGGVLSWVPIDALPEQSGKNGYYLTTDGADPYWAPIDTLPSQSGNSGKVLSTNGSTPSWIASPTIDSLLPAQSAKSGEFLTTNGVNSSWAAIPTELPAQSGNSGKKLTTNGSTPSWATDNLDSLSDVNITTPASTQILSYNGSAWVNSAAPSSLPTQSGNSGKLLSTNGATPSWVAAPTELPTQSGNSGKILTTNGSTPAWEVVPTELPAQSGNSGKKLTTNGSSPSWATDNLDSLSDVTITTPSSTQVLTYNGSAWVNGSNLPAQSGNSGKTLTTNGSSASWIQFPTELPSQSGNSGKKLTTNGSTPSWVTDNLDSLSDVTITTPASTQILSYNGSAWVNSAAPIELPAQSGNSGKALTTNGSAASWTTFPIELPSQSGKANNFLTTNGSSPSWAMPSGWTAYTATNAALPVGGTLTVTHPADSTLKRVVQGMVMSIASTPTNWWRLEEASGTIAYPSAGALNMAAPASMTKGSTGQFGYAMTINNGAGANLSAVKSYASLTAFTIDFWLKSPASFSDVRPIFSVAATTSSTTPFVAMRTDGTGGNTKMYFGGGWNVAGPVLVASTLQHITVTWDGATLKTYLGGVIATTYASGGSNQSTGTNLFFGYSINQATLAWVFDNIMLFDDVALPVEAISSTETYSYGGSWQPIQLGTASGQITVSYASDTTTVFTSNLVTTQNVNVEVLL
jgi:hypothetical protein